MSMASTVPPGAGDCDPRDYVGGFARPPLDVSYDAVHFAFLLSYQPSAFGYRKATAYGPNRQRASAIASLADVRLLPDALRVYLLRPGLTVDDRWRCGHARLLRCVSGDLSDADRRPTVRSSDQGEAGKPPGRYPHEA